MDKTHKIKSVCTFIFVMGMIITLSGNVWARGLPSSPLVYDFEHPNDELVFLPVNSSPFTRVAEADGNWAFLLEEGMIPNITEASGNYRYAILDFPRIDNFVFEIRSKGNLRNPNILLIFGWQDPLNYYYAYLTDSNATRISRVRNGLEEANFLYRTGKSSWNEDSSIYQSARLVVETISDQVIIMVYVNNETEPSLRTSISKDEYTPGNIGFGAYNASGQASYYDDIRLEIINKTGIPLLRQTLTFDDPDDSLVFEPVNQSPFTLHLETNGNRAYCLDASTLPPIDDEEPEHRYGILYPYEMGDFTFDHLVKGFPDNSTNLVVFGWKDPDNYLYVLLSEGTDTKVGRVTGGFDNVLLCPGTDTFWARNASGYQHVRVTLESRADWKYLKVYVNGELKLSYAFSQNLYSGGKVGLGMLNVPEAALYDDLFLDPLPLPFPDKPSWELKALAIANTAGEYYGTPYSPDAGTYNIDCFNSASFMKKIYSLNGINLPSTPISQAMVGKTLPGTDWDHGADFHHLAKIGLIRNGDLLFCADEHTRDKTGIERIAHVMMYCGNGLILHASPLEGYVLIEPMPGELVNSFLGATRVIEPESPILLLINEIPSITNESTLNFQGLATPGTILTIKRNYVDYSTMQLPAAGDGSFSTEVRLTPEGENVISLKCFNVKTALSTQITATVIRDVSPPYITIDPSTKRNTNEPSALIVGATSEPVSEVTVNGEQAELTLDQTAFIINVRLNEGVNLFNIQAIDFAGNAGSYELLITKDMGMPVPKDIAGHWAEAGIMELIYKGIVSGYDDNTFRPDAAITRAEFCCLIVKSLSLESNKPDVSNFSDSAYIQGWAVPYISAAYQNGIVSGFDDSSFRADEMITRAQMAVIISRCIEIVKPDEQQQDGQPFSDHAQIPQWAEEYVYKAASSGIISGYEDKTFRPYNNATRAEAATIIMRLLRLID